VGSYLIWNEYLAKLLPPRHAIPRPHTARLRGRKTRSASRSQPQHREEIILYSVGSNEMDDGGIVSLNKEGSVDLVNGDWVWRYPDSPKP